MNKMLLSAAVTTISICIGCSSVLSVHPFVATEESTQAPALNGLWEDSDRTYIIRQGPDRAYEIIVLSDESRMKFYGRLMNAGDVLFMDIQPAEEAPFHIRAHALVRIWLDEDALRWAFVDSNWFKEHTGALITDSPKAVRDLVARHAFDERAYGSEQTMRRVRK